MLDSFTLLSRKRHHRLFARTLVVRHILAAIVALLWLLLGAINSAFADASHPKVKELIIALPGTDSGVGTFNTLKSILTNDIFNLIYDRLVEQGADGEFFPALAASWTISTDGLEWEFCLRRDVVFHDGSPFDAEVAKWFLDEFRQSPSAYMVESIQEVRVVDAYTIKLQLSHPDPNLLSNLSSSYMGIPSRSALRRAGEDFGTRVVVGSGPFIFDSWIMGDRVVLHRNPAYRWGSSLSDNRGPAKIERIIFREMREATTRFLELKTGGVDILVELPVEFLELAANDSELGTLTMPSATHYHLVMNSSIAPFDDLNVRKALALSINQELIVNTIFHKMGKPAYTYLVDQVPARQVAVEREIRFDPTMAAILFSDAGWHRDSDGILTKAGKRFTVQLLTQNEAQFRRLAVVLQAQLERAGVAIEILQLDSSTIRGELLRGTHQLVLRSYGWNNADILEWFFNGERLGYPNAAMWNDPTSQSLMRAAMTGPRTLDERDREFTRYHEYLLSQYLWAPIYLPDDIYAFRKRVVLPEMRTSELVGPAMLDIDTQ